MTINMEALGQALNLLVIGWGGDFLVLGIIALASVALCKVFPAKGEGDE